MPRSTVLPDARVTPRFAGVCTFGRYPLIADVAPEHRPVDWAILGVPFDGGVTFRPGARFGPRAVREASQYLKRYSLEHDIDICAVLSLADAGDAPVLPYDLPATIDAVRAFVRSVGVEPLPGDRAAAAPPRAGSAPREEWEDDPPASAAASAPASPAAGREADVTRVLAIGGDHSLSAGAIAGAWERAGAPPGGLALLHIDAHLDTVDAVWGSPWGHASPFRRLVECGAIDPRRTLSLGLRGPLNSAADLDYPRQRGMTIVPCEQARREGAERVAAFVRGLAGAPAYISFDIDAIDPAFAPGTGTPVPAGFTPGEAFGLLRAARGINLVGADIVEVLPDRDAGHATALLASHLMFEILALDAVLRRG